MIDTKSLAIAMVLCVKAGLNPADTHNGYDKNWQLFWCEAATIAYLYNEMYPSLTSERKTNNAEPE